MDKFSAGNDKCEIHEKAIATHVCLTCNKLYCIKCGIAHSHPSGESLDTSVNTEASYSTKHNVQPIANVAAGVIENLQLTIYRYQNLSGKNELLKEISQRLTQAKKENYIYIEEIKKQLDASINDAKALFSRKIATIESTLTEGIKKLSDEEKAHRAKLALFPTLQKGYNANHFLDVYNNKDLVNKFSNNTEETIAYLEKMCELAKNEINEFKASKDGLEIIELKLEEVLGQWVYLLASKLNSPDGPTLHQKRLLLKAKRHILWNEMKDKIKELEEEYERLRSDLSFSQEEIQRLKNYEKYIEDDTFTLLAESMVGGTEGKSEAEMVFKKLGPYVRATKMPTKLVFKGIDPCPEGTYCGYWNKITDKKEGKGVMLFNDGRIYEGYWKNDLPWGHGRWIQTSGSVYEGQIHKGKFHGFGKYIWKDGEQYIGEMRHGLRDGYGMYIGNEYAYIGQWGDDKFNGYGIKSWEDGEVYVGEFKNDLKEGDGMYIWKNGEKYVGKWKNNVETGDGVLLKEEILEDLKGKKIIRPEEEVKDTL